MESLSIIVPCCCSEGKLGPLFLKISQTLKNISFEIIFVDDFSSDNTWKEITELTEKDRRIKGIKLVRNLGQQNATFAGLYFASGTYVITMDDDMEHNPDDILKLLEKVRSGFDIVYAAAEKKYSFFRKAGSFAHDIFFYAAFRKPLSLKITSFRIIKNSLVKKITQTEKSFIYISAIALKQKPAVSSIISKPVYITESRYSIIKLLNLFMKLLLHYSFPENFYKLFFCFFPSKRRSGKNIILSSIELKAGDF